MSEDYGWDDTGAVGPATVAELPALAWLPPDGVRAGAGVVPLLADVDGSALPMAGPCDVTWDGAA
ncbi:MAG: hypothetical protein M3548_07350 [Actinomycetota bacterium]|nr:hypothetical protein [Actinomycetota bacterium]